MPKPKKMPGLNPFSGRRTVEPVRPTVARPDRGVRIDIRVSQAEYNALVEAAEREERTVSTYIRSAVRERMARPGPAKPTAQVGRGGHGGGAKDPVP